MLRLLASALLLLCLLSPVSGQTPPATSTRPPQAATPTKPVKKPATKRKAAARPAEPAHAGRCGVGVITATQDVFAVQKIGLTVFGNEYAEVPVPWGLDDLIFTRVRAAAGAVPVRRIVFAKGAFNSYYHPQASLFRNRRQELSNLVRQIAGNAGCERYLVVTRGEGQFPGTNQSLTGIGIVNRGVGALSYSFLFAYLGVIALDGQSFEMIKHPGVTFESAMKHIADNLVADEHLRKADNSIFPAAAADAANSVALRDSTRGLLSERMDKILPAYFKQ